MNEGQRKLVDSIDGIYLVDAGPGTGKTFSISRRYIEILSRSDATPEDILMLTFTRNGAAEMDERVRDMIDSYERAEGIRTTVSKRVQVSTFDSLCLSILSESADDASKFFGLEHHLVPRNITLSADETANRAYFSRFMHRFMAEHGGYGDIPTLLCDDPGSVFDTIGKLVSKCMIPLPDGSWFGQYDDSLLCGNLALGDLRLFNTDSNESIGADIEKQQIGELYNPPRVVSRCVPDRSLLEAINADRGDLMRFVHDVYLEYIRQSIADNRLTYSIVSILAFVALYVDDELRVRNSYRYMMIDEFQDTDPRQMMIILMLLGEPNLCVVGDWKQGIYGFRNADVRNITEFDEKVSDMVGFLNSDRIVVRTKVPRSEFLSLTENYRSSQSIIDLAFRALHVRHKNEAAPRMGKEIQLESVGDRDGLDTDIRFVQSEDRDSEAACVAETIRDYIIDDRYIIKEKNGNTHHASYGDIAVLCRKRKDCRKVLDACMDLGVPACISGDVSVMSTREGKLALAWMRFLEDPDDRMGYIPILADTGLYRIGEMSRMRFRPRDGGTDIPLPDTLVNRRSEILSLGVRMTDLLDGIFDTYGMDNEITQAIVHMVSQSVGSSMMTVPDVISLMEDGIEADAKYAVEVPIDRDAVHIMTMHGSKGLEFPIVIAPFIDRNIMPLKSRSPGTLAFNERTGLRCSNEVGRFQSDGTVHSKICKDWRTMAVNRANSTDYDEERRLLFVALSRAMQYETVIASADHFSWMFKQLAEGMPVLDILVHDGPLPSVHSHTVQRPEFRHETSRPNTSGVHGFMKYVELTDGSKGGKGPVYGEDIHRIAESMLLGKPVDIEGYPEASTIRDFLDSMKGYECMMAEVGMTLPVQGLDMVLHGIIDLLVVYPDRVDIHDYKTDVDDRMEGQYRFQLSVYANAAGSFYGKPTRCFIRYVSQGPDAVVEFEPMTMQDIVSYIRSRSGL